MTSATLIENRKFAVENLPILVRVLGLDEGIIGSTVWENQKNEREVILHPSSLQDSRLPEAKVLFEKYGIQSRIEKNALFVDTGNGDFTETLTNA